MFQDFWAMREKQAELTSMTDKENLARLDADIEELLDRIVDISQESVSAAFGERIAKLGQKLLVLQERVAQPSVSNGTYEELFELAMKFLSNPRHIWRLPILPER
ncbi:Site-specific recombinase [Candidatus Rhodobacter oscarellae]|uniref:Site-specific recombinase n=1 Tax=Candidatus Rhodobacter oscarellae TaxID=1675527 RepID=A0A0J9EEE7_9RHOB|nr:hypothetical protein [Candidatus Rhodobacter lobularis]KMW60089.1 Site-specific recombinase [Candidatus Rhodobacter lobularis]